MSSRLKIGVISKRRNLALDREEVVIGIGCVSTPSRQRVREEVAKLFGSKPDAVFIRRLITTSGKPDVISEVHIYDDAERALQIEPEYIRLRKTPSPEGEGEHAEGGAEGEGS
ncbi:MAG: hypothetical protein ACE5OY_04205 [Candidatus Bathyarchaeia archaeon]